MSAPDPTQPSLDRLLDQSPDRSGVAAHDPVTSFAFWGREPTAFGRPPGISWIERLRGDPREDVHPTTGDGLLRHVKAAFPEVAGEPRAGLGLAPGRGVDVDERAGEVEKAQRSHVSSSVRASVFSSRYLTMTGVASDKPQAGPAPTVTARDPGTTTAPYGMTSGQPPSGRRMRPFGRS